jgi:hypothetical protein
VIDIFEHIANIKDSKKIVEKGNITRLVSLHSILPLLTIKKSGFFVLLGNKIYICAPQGLENR